MASRVPELKAESSISSGYGAIATAVAALLVYLFALRNGFAYDDAVLIPGNTRVVGGHFGQLLTTSYWNDGITTLYRPLTSLSFGLDWALANGNAAWFHFTNVVWHVIASVLAYLLLTRWFRPAAALAGALVFALHPVHVEAVANVVGRSEMMSASAIFAACLVWTAPSLSLRVRTVCAALCYAFGMLSKESAAVLPLLLLLLDGVQGEFDRDYIRRRAPHYAVLLGVFALFALVRWTVVRHVGAVLLDPAIEVTTSTGDRLLTALQVWPLQARVLFFPYTLLADYDPRVLMPIVTWTPLSVLGLTLLIATVVGGIVALVRGRMLWALGLLWFPITILTVSNLLLPIGVLLAERTLYLPAFALSLGMAAIYAHTPGPARPHMKLLLVVVLALFAVRTLVRVPEWQSTDRILGAELRDEPESFRANWHFARAARNRGARATALIWYQRAIRLWPYRESLIQEAALYAGNQGQQPLAHELAVWGINRWPRNVAFHRLIVAHAIDAGDTVSARAALVRGLRVDPSDSVLKQMWRAFGQPASKP